MFELIDAGAYEPVRPGWWRVRIAPVARIGGEVIAGRVGDETDLGTIPWWARWKIDPAGRNGGPCAIHDELLRRRRAGELDWPKWKIDIVFFALLKASGSPDLEATLMFLAVRTRP